MSTNKITMMIPAWLSWVSLSLVGTLLLIRGIKQILQALSGPVLLRLPMTQSSGLFMLTQAGDYAIWQAGRSLQRVPATMAAPIIVALPTGEKVRIHPIFSEVRVNNGWEGRIQLFSFWAQSGHYRLELPTDSSGVYAGSPYFLEIRKRTSGFVLVGGILLVLLGAFALLTGLVMSFV